MTDAPRTLGRYTLKRRLAAGGMGEVYLGESQGAANFTKQVAIKRILPHLARTPGFVSKFIDEANVMVQLHHGNIVPVLELGDEDGELYIVMEYLPGRDLKIVLQRSKAQRRAVPIDLALWITSEICDALDYAHRKTGADGHALQIVHRDVSPSNVMLGAGGEVKLVDFGIARARGSLHQSVTGTLQGKFVYMSPEQAEGLAVDARSDVFSAGLVLYELLTGHRPLEGESETETLRRVRRAEIAPPSAQRPEVDPRVDAIVLQALAREPADRWPTAAQFGRALTGELARTSSTTGARALSRYLQELFPEGVVPLATEAPLSLDDALRLQIDGADSQGRGIAHTRTATGPSNGRGELAQLASTPRTFATPDESAGSGPSSPPSPLSAPPQGFPPSSMTGPFTSPPQRIPRFRWILLGAFVAALATGALFLTPPAEVRLDVRVTPEAAVGLEVTVNGTALRPDSTYAVGTRVDVCARARDYGERCEGDYRVRADANVVRLGLEPRLALVKFEASPPETEVVVEGLESAFTQGTARNVRLGERVRVVYRAAGYESLERTYDLFSLTEPRTLFERLQPTPGGPVPPTTTSTPGAPPTEASASRPVADNGSKRPPGTVPLRLESQPTGAEVLRGGVVVGRTPLSIPVSRAADAVVFRLSGHVDLSRDVSAADAPRLAVALAPAAPGFLTVRVIPPAGTLVLDGNDLGTNVLNRRSLPAGTYDLIARFKDKSEARRVTLQPGQSLVLDPFRLAQPDDPQDAPAPESGAPETAP
ncbi:MAG: protein kinase domain-containing protein [Bradymonadia bacterium]